MQIENPRFEVSVRIKCGWGYMTPGSGGIYGPVGIGFGGDGNLYVSRVFNGDILRYNNKNGAFIDTFIKGKPGDRFADFNFCP